MKGRHRLEHRLGEQVALVRIGTQVIEPGKFVHGFDPFNNKVYAQIDANLRDCAHDSLPRAMGLNTYHQGHVQLDDIRLKLGKQIQTGVAGSEIGGYEDP